MARTPRLRVLVPVLVLGVAGLVAVFVVVGALSGGGAGSAQQTAGRDSASVASLGSAAKAVAPMAEDATGGSAGQGDVALAVPPAGTYSTHHMVRTGDLSLLVTKGTLLSTVDRITSMTTASGGYVMSSALGSDYGTPVPLAEQSGVTATDDLAVSSAPAGSSPYATLTLRVPERSFDSMLKRFAELGKMESVSTTSEDVTSQYVDLQARLRHYRAVEARLVRFLAQTDSISEMLAVQDRIDKVQLTIEQLSAQLKSLSETTTYGTLSVFVREKGTPVVVASTSSTFTGTLWHSLVLLGRGARITGLALTAILPFVVVFGVIALVAWYAVRRVRRARARTAQPSLPA